MRRNMSIRMVWDEMSDDLLMMVLWGTAIYLPIILLPFSFPDIL